MSAFDTYEFAVGSVRGIRAFRVDELGRLTGFTHRTVWTPGENIAVCQRESAGLPNESDDPVVSALLAYLAERGKDLAKHPNPCAGLDPECQCGFYAFHTGQSEYSGKATVTGVIEGYGKTILGAKGFRCEKARILGLALPEKAAAHPAPPVPPAPHGYAPGGFWSSTLTNYYITAFDHLADAALSQSLRTKVLRNYDGIPFYSDRAELLEAFPVEKPQEPTPQNDPDFWTRAVR